MDAFHAALHRAIQRCGSQLETRLLLAFLASPGIFSFRPMEDLWVDTAGVEIRQQVTIAGYRADFVLSGCLVVEVDGKVWHDSPEAAERDRKRDRALLARGWRVLRFTETEVTRDALAVAREAYALAGEVSLAVFRRPQQVGFGFK